MLTQIFSGLPSHIHTRFPLKPFQTWCCSTMTSASNPPSFWGRRFGERDHDGGNRWKHKAVWIQAKWKLTQRQNQIYSMKNMGFKCTQDWGFTADVTGLYSLLADSRSFVFYSILDAIKCLWKEKMDVMYKLRVQYCKTCVLWFSISTLFLHSGRLLKGNIFDNYCFNHQRCWNTIVSLLINNIKHLHICYICLNGFCLTPYFYH